LADPVPFLLMPLEVEDGGALELAKGDESCLPPLLEEDLRL
jgi:hypothetical protein